jgi:hypothetical protein
VITINEDQLEIYIGLLHNHCFYYYIPHVELFEKAGYYSGAGGICGGRRAFDQNNIHHSLIMELFNTYNNEITFNFDNPKAFSSSAIKYSS